jgi:hypothetical protein
MTVAVTVDAKTTARQISADELLTGSANSRC